MSMIKLNQVLKIMQAGEIFSMSFVTLDVKRKTGGKIRQIDEARIIQKQPKLRSDFKPSEDTGKYEPRLKKNPNHWTNCTRSFKIIVDGIESSSIRKVHIFLITKFNGKTVYL